MAKNPSKPARDKKTTGKEEESPSIISGKGMCGKRAKAESLKNKAAE